jgi:hypothetical protein
MGKFKTIAIGLALGGVCFMLANKAYNLIASKIGAAPVAK